MQRSTKNETLSPPESLLAAVILSMYAEAAAVSQAEEFVHGRGPP